MSTPLATEDPDLDDAEELAAQLAAAAGPNHGNGNGSAMDAARELIAELGTPPDASSNGGKIKAPSLGLLLIEGRALGELVTTYALMPYLRRGPRGDGHPVLVLPASWPATSRPLPCGVS